MLVWNSCFKIVEKVIVIETYFSLELVFFDESGPPLERVARVDCHPSILGNGWQPPVKFKPKSLLLQYVSLFGAYPSRIPQTEFQKPLGYFEVL